MPIAPPLARLLALVAEGTREGYVALNKDGEPWGQYGLDQAFDRVRDRAGLSGWSIYALRHYAITSWLRRGIPVHIVQRMAGHKHLATTQRYVHHLKSDLEDAARQLASVGTYGDLWENVSCHFNPRSTPVAKNSSYVCEDAGQRIPGSGEDVLPEKVCGADRRFKRFPDCQPPSTHLP